MTLHQLRVFVTVARLNSFAQAAKALQISQPSVSGVIQNLQDELGVKLFDRLGNKRRLTEIGKRLFERAQNSIAAIEGIKEDINALKGLKKGRIRVGGSGFAGASFLPAAVQSFQKSHPEIDVVLKIDSSNSLETALLEGDLDLAVLSRFSGSPLLAGEHYRDEEIVAMVSSDHPLARKRSVALPLIAKQPLIIQEKGTVIRNMLELRFSEEGLPFVPKMEVGGNFGNKDATIRMVANGLGIGFLLNSILKWSTGARQVKALKVPGLGLRISLYIVCHKTRKNSPLIQAFNDLLRQSSIIKEQP